MTSNYEFGGQEFESLRARQKTNNYGNKSLIDKSAMQNQIFCMASAWRNYPIPRAQGVTAGADYTTPSARHNQTWQTRDRVLGFPSPARVGAAVKTVLP